MLVYIGGLHSTLSAHINSMGVLIKGSGRSIKLVQRASLVIQTATVRLLSPTSGGTFNELITIDSCFKLRFKHSTEGVRPQRRPGSRAKVYHGCRSGRNESTTR